MGRCWRRLRACHGLLPSFPCSAASRLPIAVVRPSFITPAAGPPVDGYFVGKAGGVALASLAAVDPTTLLPPGVSMADVASARFAVIPVDVVAAAVLAAAASAAVRARQEGWAKEGVPTPATSAAATTTTSPPLPHPLPIFNVCTSGTPSPLTFGEACAIMGDQAGVTKAAMKKMLSTKGNGLDGLAVGDFVEHFKRMITGAASLEAGVAAVRAMRFDCGGLMALEAGLAPGEHVLFPLGGSGLPAAARRPGRPPCWAAAPGRPPSRPVKSTCPNYLRAGEEGRVGAGRERAKEGVGVGRERASGGSGGAEGRERRRKLNELL